MGDVAMTVPVLRAFVKQYPNVKITIVSKPFFKPFFDRIPNVDFFEVDLNERHKGFLGLFRLYSDLKKLNVDAFADLHQVLRTKIVRTLFILSGRKTASLDKMRAAKTALTRPENKIFKPLAKVFDNHAKVFSELGFPIDLTNPVFPPRQILDKSVLEITGEHSQKWIGVAPFAQHQAKVYPQDLMQETIDLLALNPDYKIFLFGGGLSETKVLNELAQNHQNVIVVAGRITFEQELQLISNLDLMLSMDSGNSHIAAMYGINTITLWGATHPFTGFSPFNQPLENALVSDRKQFPKLPTSVYGNKLVEGYEDAMRTITPESIIEKIKTSLN